MPHDVQRVDPLASEGWTIVYLWLRRGVVVGALMGVAWGCLPDDGSPDLEEVTLAEVVTVGVLEGAEEEEFGLISDVWARDDGSFFVLDGQAGVVAWFDGSGQYIDGLRSQGAGPGELERPSSIALSSTGQLRVLDPGNGRINRYLADEGQLRFEDHARSTWSSLGMNRALCSLDERWYVRGPRDGYVVHEIADDGEVIRSFSDAEPVSEEEFGPFAQIVRPQLNAGKLLCLKREQLIATVGAMSARIRAHTSEGELAWEVEVPGIHTRRFVVDEGALGTGSQVEAGFHQIRSLVRWSPESILVQYSWHPADDPREEQALPRFESVELAISDGSELGRTSALPLIVDVKDEMVYSSENRPYPRVRVLRREG